MQIETAEHATLESILRATGFATAFIAEDLPAARKLERRAERAQNDPVARIYFADAALGHAMASGEPPRGARLAGSATRTAATCR